jgi:quercetin dioxygenase-like cupin family protein
MIETVYELSGGNERVIEKILEDENIQLFHMVFHQNEGLPENVSDAITYATVMKGTLSIALDRQKPHEYVFGSILKIPSNTKIKIKNVYEDVLEVFIVKYPAPKVGDEHKDF